MSDLDTALAIAVEAHRGQVDKAGQPYILHPLRVMARVSTPAERLVAVLHDVVEDSPTTLDDLRAAGFPEEVVRAVDFLTRREDETYEAFIERVTGDPLARRVKLADLEDNMTITRLNELDDRAVERLGRYLR
ncbi:MAG TPA: HD domain-containing protein, partial [Dehalococcoidia bacterium]|nr:HD domain-containing protein [Dehalococcoidia bacterium]